MEAVLSNKEGRTRLGFSRRTRKNFDERRRTCRLTFDDLHKRFLGVDSLETIAAEAGISGSRLTYLYKTLFMPMLGLPSPRSRTKEILAKRKAMALRVLKQLPKDKSLERVTRRLKSKGHMVQVSLCDEHGGIPRRRHRRRLKIDGQLSSWHRISNVLRGRGAASPGYSATTLSRSSLEKTKFAILEVAPIRYKPMILKIPSKALWAEFFAHNNHDRVRICVPLDTIPDEPRFPFLNYLV
jgi:hypothetical protein